MLLMVGVLNEFFFFTAIPRPRPVLSRETGFLDRLMESLVGDGPSYRYALICNKCHGHNGMALQEEFPFLGKLLLLWSLVV